MRLAIPPEACVEEATGAAIDKVSAEGFPPKPVRMKFQDNSQWLLFRDRGWKTEVVRLVALERVYLVICPLLEVYLGPGLFDSENSRFDAHNLVDGVNVLYRLNSSKIDYSLPLIRTEKGYHKLGVKIAEDIISCLGWFRESDSPASMIAKIRAGEANGTISVEKLERLTALPGS